MVVVLVVIPTAVAAVTAVAVAHHLLLEVARPVVPSGPLLRPRVRLFVILPQALVESQTSCPTEAHGPCGLETRTRIPNQPAIIRLFLLSKEK